MMKQELDLLKFPTSFTARRIVSALPEKEVLLSDSPRSPLRLAFSAALASRWMPGLFPDKPQ